MFEKTGLYYGVSICLVSFASGLSVVTLNLHHRGLRGTAVPYYLRRIVLDCLARVVFLRFEADPVADLHHQQRSSPTGTNRDNGNQAITRQVESSAASTSTTVTTRSDSSSKSLRRDPRCTCNHPTESINRKRRKPAISVTQSSLSAWLVLTFILILFDLNNNNTRLQAYLFHQWSPFSIKWKTVTSKNDFLNSL